MACKGTLQFVIFTFYMLAHSPTPPPNKAGTKIKKPVAPRDGAWTNDDIFYYYPREGVVATVMLYEAAYCLFN